MKTHQNDSHEIETAQTTLRNNGLTVGRAIPTKSIRPQKSMVRVKSLKPRRMNIASKVAVKKLS